MLHFVNSSVVECEVIDYKKSRIVNGEYYYRGFFCISCGQKYAGGRGSLCACADFTHARCAHDLISKHRDAAQVDSDTATMAWQTGATPRRRSPDLAVGLHPATAAVLRLLLLTCCVWLAASEGVSVCQDGESSADAVHTLFLQQSFVVLGSLLAQYRILV